MNIRTLALSGAAGTMFVASSASAAFVGGNISLVSASATTNQWSVNIAFNHPADVLNSVGGALGKDSLSFNTNDPMGLRNTGAGGGVGPDIFNPYGPAGNVDSFLRIGTATGVSFTPNFLTTMGGDAGGHVAGTNWMVADDGYFKAGGVAVGVGQISIANFVLGNTAGFGFGFSGLVGWSNNVTMDGTLSGFSVNNKPAPGALALLGLAGLAGGRRRRN